MSSGSTRILLFGAPRIVRGGAGIALPVRKTMALFVYLAVEGRSTRSRLADLFWSELDETTARRNLRRALHRVRTAGLGDVLVADDDTVALAGVGSDFADFDAAIAEGRLAAALALASGRWCDGLDLDDAPAFGDWLRTHRDHCLRGWRGALRGHAGELEAAGRPREALAAHALLLDHDPLQEATYRDLMRLHDALGERTVALELYGRCQRTLAEELQLEPLPETRLLAERIRLRAAPVPPAAVEAVALRPQLRAVPMVARERELAALIAASEPVVLVEGEAGIGKSRLVVETWQRARGAVAADTAGLDPSPLVVRFSEMSASTPFHAIADALRSPAAVARLAGIDAESDRDLARLLPERRPNSASDPELAQPAPAEARTRLLEALARALALAAGPERLLIFDDLHWADASSIELLSHLARRYGQEPSAMARVLATARGSELADNGVAVTAIESLARDRLLSRLPLAGFDEWSMLQLVQRLSGSQGGVRFAARLGAATGGNVLFALETIRALFESGELHSDAVNGWHTKYDASTTDYAEMPLPASVVEAVRGRVARLGAAAQRVLETAALAEDGSTLAEIQGATALGDWEALEGIERAVAAHVVDRTGGGYRFVHDLIRVAIRSGLSPERQRLMHAKLAAALEPLGASPTRIASHWQRAGADEKASTAWLRAAEAAVALHAHREAVEHFERAAALTSDEESASASHDRAIGQAMVGRLDAERHAIVARMLDKAENSGSSQARFRAFVRAAEGAAHDRDYPLCEQLARRALSDFTPPDVRFHVHALSCLATAVSSRGRREDALAGFRRAADVAREGGNARAEAMMSASASSEAVECDRLDEAATLRDRALLLSRTEGHTIARAQVVSKSAFASRALGERAAALRDMEEAVTIGRVTRSDGYLVYYLANLCEGLLDDGQHEAALACHQELVDVFGRSKASDTQYIVTLTAAVMAEATGQLGVAIESAAAAVAVADSMDNPSDQREARFMQARLLAAVGAPDRGEPLIAQAEGLRPPDWQVILLQAVQWRAEAGLSLQPADARSALMTALAAPFADRLLHAHIDAARITLGRCGLAAGRADEARDAVRGVRYSVALEADALAVRLMASALDGAAHGDRERGEAAALLDRGRLPPLAALTLMRALSAGRRRGAPPWRARMQAVAQALADSLQAAPALQAAFIRKHRDLLT